MNSTYKKVKDVHYNISNQLIDTNYKNSINITSLKKKWENWFDDKSSENISYSQSLIFVSSFSHFVSSKFFFKWFIIILNINKLILIYIKLKL